MGKSCYVGAIGNKVGVYPGNTQRQLVIGGQVAFYAFDRFCYQIIDVECVNYSVFNAYAIAGQLQ